MYKLFWGIRMILMSILFGKVGFKSYLGKPSYISGFKFIFFGNRVRIFPGSRMEALYGGKIIVSDDCSIGQNLHIISYKEELIIGKKVTISGNVFISNCDHTFDLSNKHIMDRPLISRKTYIGDFSFIGYGAVILPGTNLGKNNVVGANSVVRGNFPDNCVIAGVPAKIIKIL